MTDNLPLRTHPRGKDTYDRRHYQQRLKAAGLAGDMPEDTPVDMDAFRNRLARCIFMFVNACHGCPEPLCRRHHGCMAPNGRCSNLPPRPEKELERDWPRARAEIYKALQARLAAQGEPQGR
jgi:hypothetical protein